MKKAIFVIASTAIALYTIKNREKKHNKNNLYYPYTLFFIFPLKDFLLLIPNVLSGIFTHILKGHIYKWIHNNYTF
ncbi:hypothetical protein FO511_28685 [Bacillus paranthracis]|nr:hypothetical protein [Bacillus paranthracis]MDR4395136.1 hypothetical protein [Bacillus paranthracis]